MEAWRQELYHHGIKGQRWGVRKGPPYPLDAKDHTAAEKKAGWRKSLNGGSGDESKPKKKSKLWSGEQAVKKVLIVSGTVAVGALTAYAIYKGRNYYVDAIKNKKAVLLEKAAKLSAERAVAQYEKNLEFDKKGILPGKGLAQRGLGTEIKTRGKTFSDAEQFNSYMRSMTNETLAHEDELFDREYWKKCSRQQKAAVKEYTAYAFEDMNKLLRFGEDSIPERRRKTVKRLVDDCSQALNGAVLPHDMIATRGISQHALNRMLGLDVSNLTEADTQSLLNRTFTDTGFYSASIKEGGDVWFKNGVTIRTIIPKGSKGMYVAPVSNVPEEQEVLLQRNTDFRIVDFETNRYGNIVNMTVEVLNHLHSA